MKRFEGMQPWTLREFRAAHESGGIHRVTAVAVGRKWIVIADTVSAGRAVLVLTVKQGPRQFVEPRNMLRLLREAVDLRRIEFDMTTWSPDEGADPIR